MEGDFAEALSRAGSNTYAVMVGAQRPNSGGGGVVLGLVAAIVIITRSKTQVHLGKNGILIGREIDGKIDWVIEELKSVRLAMLRLNLIFEENSLKDRIKDGDKYVEMGGGNGAASVLVEELKTRRVFRRRGPR